MTRARNGAAGGVRRPRIPPGEALVLLAEIQLMKTADGCKHNPVAVLAELESYLLANTSVNMKTLRWNGKRWIAP